MKLRRLLSLRALLLGKGSEIAIKFWEIESNGGKKFKLNTNSFSHDHFLNVVIENLTKLGNELIDLCSFAELNIDGVRKILKKFDKKFAEISVPLA